MAKKPRSPRKPAKSHRPPQTPSRDLKIDVTGDVFFERFLWPAVDPTTPLPYTAPDELRTATPSYSFRELSGAPLHAHIIESYLKHDKTARRRNGELRDGTVTTTPVPDHGSSSRNLKEDQYGPYSVYLHRLGPFPVTETSSERDEDFVWRIKESFGDVRIPAKAKIAKLPSRLLQLTRRWLTELPQRLDDPTIIVVNDRNVRQPGAERSNTRELFEDALQSLPNNWMDSDTARKDNLLILWHAREPLFKGNPVGEFLLQSNLALVTIPIINHNCLRDHGVPLRFDTSYESTIRTLLDSLSHDTIDALLRFPHIIIRFDYGFLHLTTRRPGELRGLDIHGLNAGPYRVNPQRHGIMPGMTPLLLASIIAELVDFIHDTNNPSPTVATFLRRCARYTHPTLCNSTPLDRALDVALLLAGRHYYSGYGAYKPLQPLSLMKETGTRQVYDLLFAAFNGAVDYENIPPITHRKRRQSPEDDEKLFWRYNVKYQHIFPAVDRLSRLSVPEVVLGRSPNAQAARAVFSRTHLLDDETLLHLSPAFSKDDFSHKGSITDTVLRKIVECGLDRVVSRRVGTSELIAPRDVGKSAEPSVLCPFVAFGRHLSTDWHDIDSFLALRHLVEKYVTQGDFDQPLAVAIFGPPGSGKSSLVREILGSIPRCTVYDDLVCNLSQMKSPDRLARHFHRVQDRSVKADIPIVFFDEFDSANGSEDVGWLRYFLMPLQDGLYVEGDETFDVGRAVFIFAGGVSHSYEKFCSRFGEMKTQKVPDFISRLRCFVNVQDIAFEPGNPDRATQVRRAVILRRILQRRMPQIVDQNSKIAHVWTSITDAFLNVPAFVHGVRSMEAIVQMSRVSLSAQNFQPSALPHPSQLAMHVDATEFMRIVHDG
jgi:hypothetical protein